ncbi:uncharacterized protein LOC135814581 isoform X1 [Sycon ciliatum]|uniref:uncharacterized protein LOC135814581 isoform X1 n=1 Tax=Sycon ciliatum TaxID=27933 RepID=UPI0031F6225C
MDRERLEGDRVSKEEAAALLCTFSESGDPKEGYVVSQQVPTRQPQQQPHRKSSFDVERPQHYQAQQLNTATSSRKTTGMVSGAPLRPNMPHSHGMPASVEPVGHARQAQTAAAPVQLQYRFSTSHTRASSASKSRRGDDAEGEPKPKRRSAQQKASTRPATSEMSYTYAQAPTTVQSGRVGTPERQVNVDRSISKSTNGSPATASSSAATSSSQGAVRLVDRRDVPQQTLAESLYIHPDVIQRGNTSLSQVNKTQAAAASTKAGAGTVITEHSHPTVLAAQGSQSSISQPLPMSVVPSYVMAMPSSSSAMPAGAAPAPVVTVATAMNTMGGVVAAAGGAASNVMMPAAMMPSVGAVATQMGPGGVQYLIPVQSSDRNAQAYPTGYTVSGPQLAAAAAGPPPPQGCVAAVGLTGQPVAQPIALQVSQQAAEYSISNGNLPNSSNSYGQAVITAASPTDSAAQSQQHPANSTLVPLGIQKMPSNHPVYVQVPSQAAGSQGGGGVTDMTYAGTSVGQATAVAAGPGGYPFMVMYPAAAGAAGAPTAGTASVAGAGAGAGGVLAYSLPGAVPANAQQYSYTLLNPGQASSGVASVPNVPVHHVAMSLADTDESGNVVLPDKTHPATTATSQMSAEATRNSSLNANHDSKAYSEYQRVTAMSVAPPAQVQALQRPEHARDSHQGPTESGSVTAKRSTGHTTKTSIVWNTTETCLYQLSPSQIFVQLLAASSDNEHFTWMPDNIHSLGIVQGHLLCCGSKKLWSWQDKSWVFCSNLEDCTAMCSTSPDSMNLLVCCGKKLLRRDDWMDDIEGGDGDFWHYICDCESFSSIAQCKQFVFGSFNGNVAVFNIRRPSKKWTILEDAPKLRTLAAHGGTVYGIDVNNHRYSCQLTMDGESLQSMQWYRDGAALQATVDMCAGPAPQSLSNTSPRKEETAEEKPKHLFSSSNLSSSVATPATSGCNGQNGKSSSGYATNGGTKTSSGSHSHLGAISSSMKSQSRGKPSEYQPLCPPQVRFPIGSGGDDVKSLYLFTQSLFLWKMTSAGEFECVAKLPWMPTAMAFLDKTAYAVADSTFFAADIEMDGEEGKLGEWKPVQESIFMSDMVAHRGCLFGLGQKMLWKREDAAQQGWVAVGCSEATAIASADDYVFLVSRDKLYSMHPDPESKQFITTWSEAGPASKVWSMKAAGSHLYSLCGNTLWSGPVKTPANTEHVWTKLCNTRQVSGLCSGPMNIGTMSDVPEDAVSPIVSAGVNSQQSASAAAEPVMVSTPYYDVIM